VHGDRGYQGCAGIIKAKAPAARDFTNRRVRKQGFEDEAERMRNRAKSRTRARVGHPFLVLKRLWGFAKVRYRGLTKNASRAFTALAMVNLYMAARREPALARP
jgi:IS5 family transposase